MKQKSILLTLGLLAVTGGWAQAPQAWSMDDCIDYALGHAISIQRKTLEAANAKTDVGIALSGFLPSVSVGTSAQYSWGRNVDPETNTYKSVTTFGNAYSLYASLQVFDGGQTINRFRQARLLRQQGQTRLQQARDDKAIEVMEKFVDAAYAQQCVTLAEDKLAESRRLLAKTQRMEQLGAKSLPDVAQIESQVAEDDYNLTHQQNQLQTALLALKSTMNYDLNEELRMKNEASEQSSSASFFILHSSLPASLAAEQSVRSAKLDYQIAKGRLLPSLSLQAGVSTSYFRSLGDGGAAPPFHSQFRDNMGEYVSASLSLPLFALSHHQEVRKARRNVALARLERDETLRRLDDAARQALLDCEGYGKEVEKMERKVVSDSLACHLASRKYDEGMLSVFDLHTSSQALLESRIRLLQTQMLLAIKQRLVMYYENGKIWTKSL